MTKLLTFHALCGIPGSGKSTYAQNLLRKDPKSIIICPDEYRLELTGDMSNQSQNEFIFKSIIPARIKETMNKKQSVIFDATNISKSCRKDPLELAKAIGYYIIAHLILTPFEECVRRNNARSRVVPLTVLQKMHRQLEIPNQEAEKYIDEILRVENS